MCQCEAIPGQFSDSDWGGRSAGVKTGRFGRWDVRRSAPVAQVTICSLFGRRSFMTGSAPHTCARQNDDAHHRVGGCPVQLQADRNGHDWPPAVEKLTNL